MDKRLLEVGLNPIKGGEYMENCLTGSEALFGFCAWLSSRKEKIVISSEDDAALLVELIQHFCKKNKLPGPRENWTDYLTVPNQRISQSR